MRKNAVRRNTATRVIFSEENLKTVQKNNQNYLLEISRTGRELDPAAPTARVFGIWGNDVCDEVIAWEKKTGKELSSGFERGAKLLREFHNKRRSLIVAGTVGVPLTVPSLKIAAQGIMKLQATTIDISAAFASDFDGLSNNHDLDFLGRFDDLNDTELLQER